MPKGTWFRSWTGRNTSHKCRRPVPRTLHLDRLEDRTVPTAGGLIVTGAGATGGPHVKVFDAATGAMKFDFMAYDPAFTGGVRVAVADVNGDGVPDIITAPGPGGGPVIRVFDGATHQLVREFNAFDSAFRGGVTVAAADFNGDGKAEIVVAPDAGGGPVVRVFDGATNSLMTQFNAYDPNFRGGVNLAVGEVTGDGVPDIVTGAGVGGGPHVKVFDGSALSSAIVARQFFAYNPLFRGGVFVAATNSAGGNSTPGLVITGAGAGGSPFVNVFNVNSGPNPQMTASFQAFPTSFAGGVRVTTADVAGNADIVIAPGRDDKAVMSVGPRVVVTTTAGLLVRNNLIYDSGFRGGVYVGGSAPSDPASPPEASFTAAPANEGATGQVAFSNANGGSGGYRYSYDFDNNGTFEITDSTSATATVPASYLPDGPSSRTVHGRIKDSSGAFTDYTATVAVANVPPTVQAGGPYSAAPGVSINFVATVTDPSPVDTAAGFTYTWDFGDGSAPSSLAAPSHSYATVGTYTLSLTVRDKDGGLASATTTVSVGSAAGSFIITPFDSIPNFGANPTITASHSGNWSDVNTWSLGRLPTAGDVVSISGNTIVTYDMVSDAALNTVAVQAGASLVFRTDLTTRLTVLNLLVLPGGTLQIGSVAAPVDANVKAEVVIPDQPFDTVQDPMQYGHGLIALGKVTICGAVRSNSYIRLAAEPLAGQTTLTLAQPVTGWQVGDRIVLPDTRQLTASSLEGYVLQYEEATIAAISADGLTLTLTAPLQFSHLGARDGNNVLDFLPDVGNLTRNVVIRSANSTGIRGHAFFTYRADIDIRYADFAGLGRTTVGAIDNTTFDSNGGVTHLGTNEDERFPVQFDHLFGPLAPPPDGFQYTFIGNAVFCHMMNNPYKWGVTINDSHYGIIQDNFIYDWGGAGLVTKQGNESFNVIANNFSERGVGMGDRLGSGNPGSEGSAFWFRGPNNYVRDNVGANYTGNVIEAAYGFKYFLYYLGNIRVPNFQGADTSVAGQYTLTNGNATPILECTGNEAYGVENGLTYWWVNSFGNSGQSGGTSVIQDFHVWHQYLYGIYGYQASNMTIDGYVVRGDSAIVAPANGGGYVFGLFIGDYYAGDFTLINADIQNMTTGVFRPSTFTYGTTFTIQDSLFRNLKDISIGTLYTSGYRGDAVPSRRIDIRNVLFEALPGLQHTAISMEYDVNNRVVNLTQTDEIFVYDYDQIPGYNFQLYYTQQQADFVLPQSTFNSDGTPRVVGSPVAGLTNQQNWDLYGIALGGAVAPASATTIADINGLVRLF